MIYMELEENLKNARKRYRSIAAERVSSIKNKG